MWAKLLASQLEQNDIVKIVYLEQTLVQAVYKTGIRETYNFKIKRRKKQRPPYHLNVSPRSAAIRHEIPIFKEFRHDPLDDSPTYHWCINRNHFNESTLLERRIAFHRLLREILNTKPEPDWYPYEILEEDWQHILKYPSEKYMRNGALMCFLYGRSSPFHYRILEHFFNPGGDHSGRILYKALRLVCRKKRLHINSANVRKVARWHSRRRIISPLLYCALFKALKITGPVGDLHPGFGSKALACAIMGLPYYTVKDARFQRALDLGLSSLTRAEFGWLEGQPVDLLISDDNFNSFQMPTGDILNQARKLLCYAPKNDKQILAEQHNPNTILQLFNDAQDRMLRSPNYLFLW
jgi:hypothetical protein